MKIIPHACLLLHLGITLAAAQQSGTNVSPATPLPPVIESNTNVKHVTAPEAATKLAEASANKATSPEKTITIIDVRTPEEFAEEHLIGAQNLDLASPDFSKKLATLDSTKTYLVHCASGGRSTRSLSLMNKLGFQSILHLDGGLKAWKEAGLPLEKPVNSQ